MTAQMGRAASPLMPACPSSAADLRDGAVKGELTTRAVSTNEQLTVRRLEAQPGRGIPTLSLRSLPGRVKLPLAVANQPPCGRGRAHHRPAAQGQAKACQHRSNTQDC